MEQPISVRILGYEIIRQYRGATLVWEKAYEDPALAEVEFGRWSLFKTPWRAFVDAWPVGRFDQSLAMYMWNVGPHFQDAHRAPIAQLFAEIGIKSARIEIGWNNLTYDNPSILSAEKVTEFTAKLQILQAAGIRPLILLNSHDGLPCPYRYIPVTMNAATAGATSVTFTTGTLADIRPHYTGFDGTYGKGAYPLITAINTSTGVASLSAPLPGNHPGGSFNLLDLKFHPFSGAVFSGGTANPLYEETYQGWLAYVTGVTSFAAGVLGTTDFDVEVWNELSFGSHFTNERNYYNPERTWSVNIPLYSNHGVTLGRQNEHFHMILARTTDLVRNPVNGWANVRVINGFTNTLPWAFKWPGLYGYSHHYYQALQPDPLPSNGSYLPNNDAIAANGSIEKPGWVPAGLGWGLPEYWYYAYVAESLHHELVPWPSLFQGHGRYELEPSGRPVALAVWQTECNTDRRLWLEEIQAAENVTQNNSNLIALSHHQAAKLVLRSFVFNAHQGLERFFLFSEHSDYAFEFLPPAVYPLLTSKGYVVDDEVRVACGAQYNTLKRFRAAMLAGADETIDTARKLTVSSVWENTPRKVWTGDGTAAHPDRTNREDLAVLPFMVNSTKWAVPCYVVTRDAGAEYDLTKGRLDPLRYAFPPQTFEVELSNLRGIGATVSLYDALTDTTTVPTILSSSATSIKISLQVTDYPRILFITETTAGPLIKNVKFDVAYRFVRWTITATRSSSLIQASEFRLTLDGVAVSLTGTNISNPGGGVVTGEEIAKLIDGDINTKWFDGNYGANGNSSVVILDAGIGQSLTFDRYQYATGNDAPERDPVSWTLEGSDNGTSWVLLDTRANVAVTTARQVYTAAFNVKPRLRFTTNVSAAPVVSWGDVPSRTSGGSTTLLSGVSHSVAPTSMVYGQAAKIEASVGGLVARWPIWGHDVLGQWIWPVPTTSVASASYRHIRWRVTALRSSGLMQAADFQLRHGADAVSWEGVVCTNPGGPNIPGEGPSELIDGFPDSKIFDGNFGMNNGTSTFLFDAGPGNQLAFNGYRIATANDAPERDPMSWTLEGSQDGTNWTLLDTRTGQSLPVARRTWTGVYSITAGG